METLTLLIESPKYGKFEVLYDAEDEDKISKYAWFIKYVKISGKCYVQASIPHPSGDWYYYPSGQRQRRQRRRTILPLHQLIMETPKGMQTDHINGNPLDNRKENLRICTNAENQRNRGPQKNNTSGFKGVHWNTRRNMWQSYIAHNKKQTALGYFKDKEKAARAYDRKAIVLHGEFAYTNFPIEDYQ